MQSRQIKKGYKSCLIPDKVGGKSLPSTRKKVDNSCTIHGNKDCHPLSIHKKKGNNSCPIPAKVDGNLH